MLAQPMTPMIYEVVEQTTPQTTVVDVLLGSFTFVGVLGLGAVLLGLTMAGGLILLRRSRGNPVAGSGGATRLGIDITRR